MTTSPEFRPPVEPLEPSVEQETDYAVLAGQLEQAAIFKGIYVEELQPQQQREFIDLTRKTLANRTSTVIPSPLVERELNKFEAQRDAIHGDRIRNRRFIEMRAENLGYAYQREGIFTEIQDAIALAEHYDDVGNANARNAMMDLLTAYGMSVNILPNLLKKIVEQ